MPAGSNADSKASLPANRSAFQAVLRDPLPTHPASCVVVFENIRERYRAWTNCDGESCNISPGIAEPRFVHILEDIFGFCMIDEKGNIVGSAHPNQS